MGVVFSGLIGLSIMPHQEARFLCPLLVPFIMIYTWKRERVPPLFWTTWFLFNFITAYVFGIIHQGGVVPAMWFLNRQTSGLTGCHVLNYGDLSCTANPTGKLNFLPRNNTVIYSRMTLGASNVNGFDITTNLVFYKTYMPPRHLLVVPKGKYSKFGIKHIIIYCILYGRKWK